MAEKVKFAISAEKPCVWWATRGHFKFKQTLFLPHHPKLDICMVATAPGRQTRGDAGDTADLRIGGMVDFPGQRQPPESTFAYWSRRNPGSGRAMKIGQCRWRV